MVNVFACHACIVLELFVILEQKRRQFWNRQRIPNKSTFTDFRFSLSVFCYFRMNYKNVVFFPYNFYIPIENVMRIENGDENKK